MFATQFRNNKVLKRMLLIRSTKIKNSWVNMLVFEIENIENLAGKHDYLDSSYV